eukprot:356187-Chlamydomonas_euryale.AAC.6
MGSMVLSDDVTAVPSCNEWDLWFFLGCQGSFSGPVPGLSPGECQGRSPGARAFSGQVPGSLSGCQGLSPGARVLSWVPGSYWHPYSRRYVLRSIRCGRSFLRYQHLYTDSCRRIPSHVPPTYLAGALWPPEGQAQLLAVAGSQVLCGPLTS